MLAVLLECSCVAAMRLATRRPKLWLLDRDGCINRDVGAPGVVRAQDLELIPGAAGAIRGLRVSAPVAIVTNQSCRGKGLLTAEGLDDIHETLRHLIARTGRGGRVGREQWDALYVCEDAGPSMRKKPQPGMLLEALEDFNCVPCDAVMVGDSWGDVVAAHRAGCLGVLLATGHGESLGATLRQQGVRLPATLSAEAISGGATTAGMASDCDGTFTLAAWMHERNEEEAALVCEALRSDVTVYADLAQAVETLAGVTNC